MYTRTQLTNARMITCKRNAWALVKAAAILCVISTAVDTASAQWGSQGGGSSGYYAASGYGSSGGYASSGGYSGGSSGHVGPVRRLGARMREHHATRHANRHNVGYGSTGYGSAGCYGSMGGYGSTGYGSTGSYGSAGGYGSTGYGSTGGYGSSGSYGAAYGAARGYGSTGTGISSSYYGASNVSSNSRTLTNAKQLRHQPTVMAAVPATAETSIQLDVKVPTEAKLFINELATTSNGAMRKFVSNDLEKGRSYEFAVRAEVIGKDGKLISETKKVLVQAGESENIQFTFSDRSNMLVATTQAN